MKKWIGVGLIAIMFLSTIAFAIIQALSFSGVPQAQEQQQQTNELPSEPIINYRLSGPQFNEAISRGLTVATYRYDPQCTECSEERAFLEQLVITGGFEGQVILEEIESPGKSNLEIVSYLDRRNMDEISQEQVFRTFCDLVAQPPVSCAV
jgi:hypothetical protein